MPRAYIGLGANLGQPGAQVSRALQHIASEPGLRLLAQSSLYRSAPLGPGPQPDYCNAACMVETTLEPRALLQRLQAIEVALGRQRPVQRWAARTIDLDLLHYEGASGTAPGLTLPHPELQRRNFVVVPLAEVNPGLDLPGVGPVAALAQRLGRDGLALWV